MPMKNSRGGKRGPNSSSSSFLSTITTVVLVAFCVVGVWFYTSSTSSSSAVSFSDRLTTRLSLRDVGETDPPPALDDTEGELPEDAIKGDHNLQEEKVSKAAQDSTDQEQEQKQINLSEENDIQSEVQQQNEVHSEEQQKKDEQSSEEQQQQQQQNADVSNEQQQQEEVNTDVAEEKKVESNGGEEVTTENVSNEQEFRPQIDEKVQRDIEEGEGGGGITSQAQIEHDTDGTSEEQQQQKQSQDSTDKPLTGESRVEVSDKNGKTWATQADRSVDEKDRRKEEAPLSDGDGEISNGGEWEVCNVTAGPDYIPCLDNEKALKELRSFKHFEHRERHCPEEGPTCLVALPEGYKRPIEWPQSRGMVMDKRK